jgi:hypothetical protein
MIRWWRDHLKRFPGWFGSLFVSRPKDSPIELDLSAIHFEMDNDDSGIEFGQVAPRYLETSPNPF